MPTRRAVHGFVHISVRAIQLLLRFRIYALGAVCLALGVAVEQWIIARRGGVDGHTVRSLSVMIIGVIPVHMAPLWLDQTLLALHVAAALHSFLIRLGGPAVTLRSATVVSVGGRGSWVVAIVTRVEVSVSPTVSGLAKSATLLTPRRGLARPLRQRHCGPIGGVSVRWDPRQQTG